MPIAVGAAPDWAVFLALFLLWWSRCGCSAAWAACILRRAKKVTVLVVEDEAIIRLGTAQMLEDAGYAVVEAENADAAINILETRNDIRVVFTDIKMSGTLCGLRLARAVRDRWPPIRLIVASGLSAPTEKEFPGVGRFIRKPYAAEHVLAALGELLSPNPAPYRYFDDVIQNYGKVA